MDRDSLNNVKRRVYIASIMSGILSLVLLWANSGNMDPAMVATVAVITLFFLGCVLALWRRLLPIVAIERIAFVGGAGFALMYLAYTLYASGNLSGARTGVSEISVLTLTALYVVAPLIFDRRTALWISLALFGTTLVLMLTKVVAEIPVGLDAGEVSWVVRMNGFMAAIIALSYASSYVKEEMMRQRIATETMRRLADTDPLTGIANRRRFYSDLRDEMERARRYDLPLCVILFDLDHFKEINDSFGHERGDLVLQEIVGVVRPVLRRTDHLSRWGGEEFIIMTPETDLHQSNRLAERLRDAIASYELESTPGITASFGIARYKPGENEPTLIKRADQALYRAKNEGRNRVVEAV